MTDALPVFLPMHACARFHGLKPGISYHPASHISWLRGFSIGLCLVLAAMAQGQPSSAPMQVFLLIGQSNMAGRAAIGPQDRVPDPHVYVLTKQLTWAPAVDPLHFDKPEIAGVGPGLSFGRALAAAEPQVVIGLVPAAFGGTSLDDWKPGGELYNAAVARTRTALQHGRLAGILWHQGESDSSPELAATYAARFAALIARLRADLSAPEVPVIVGETGRFRPDAGAINRVLSDLPQTVRACAFVSAEGLTDKGDRLHFDTRSQHELGQRYARAWLALAQASGGGEANRPL